MSAVGGAELLPNWGGMVASAMRAGATGCGGGSWTRPMGMRGAEKRERVRLYNSGEPGFSLSACQYLASRKVILTGGDTSADAGPVTESPGSVSLCHIELQARHGIWNLENLDFEPLLTDKVSEFLFVWAPLKMVGATGSPGNPVAIY